MTKDQVNRSLLAEGKTRLTAERDRLVAERRWHDGGARTSRINMLNDKLAGVNAIEERLAKPPSLAHPRPYLLSFSTEGTGRVIISVGDPDTAANVVTFVPGTFSRLGRQGRAIKKIDAIALSAAKAGSPSTAVINWADYRAPQSLVPEALHTRYADGAKADLGRFLDDLRTTHEGPPSHNTVVGYSYGSLVAGVTARDVGLNVDDVVFVASPGVGVEHAGALHLTGVAADDVGAHVHTVIVRNDPVAGLRIFGPQPADPAFGGRAYESEFVSPDPWRPTDPGRAHASYFAPGSITLVNIGRIAAGLPGF
ncbi:alpha/beta hydrolase [Actinoallomurus bryophytorum]|uniref:alpha/beta hydrolase n=1 Tax=Actinoallomurus bryophytorum TaxID=1490222 RepID=UPI00163AE15D|nr:alpha/beta hydrolase [Actinoallomurus bryophytorum]